ncbi:hypothetical protein [Tenacibaculum halocynthiae]|uniref:hypothetical protein n=1 Tax=Tenacibaculum halocynthiae TaxID=1254437 RepID=UPI003D6533BC
MKWLFAFLLFIVFNFDNIPDYVQSYHKATTKEQEVEFINKYKNSSKINIIAYVVSLEMKQAKYKFFPWKKLSIFNKGKKKLEGLIRDNPDNVDLRYVRLVIQENVPSLLNYKSNITEDKLFLSKIMKIKDTSDYLDFYIKKNTSL